MTLFIRYLLLLLFIYLHVSVHCFPEKPSCILYFTLVRSQVHIAFSSISAQDADVGGGGGGGPQGGLADSMATFFLTALPSSLSKLVFYFSVFISPLTDCALPTLMQYSDPL